MSLLYVYWQMTIFGSDNGSSELVYIVASRCHDTPPPFLIDFLEKVKQNMEDITQSPERKMLLEFIPIQALCGKLLCTLNLKAGCQLLCPEL